MNRFNHDSGDLHADELLQAAERALFDATTRLQEALSLIDRQGLHTSEDTLERVRQWSDLIHRGLTRLDAAKTARRIAGPGVLEA